MSETNERQEMLAKLFGMVNAETQHINQNGGQGTAVAQGGNILMERVTRDEFLRGMMDAKKAETRGKNDAENKRIESFAEKLIGGKLPQEGPNFGVSAIGSAESLEVLKSIDSTLKNILVLISKTEPAKV